MGKEILATSSAQHFKVDTGNLKVGRFPNGEVSAVLETDVRNKEVVLVGSTGAPAENLIELFWALETIVRNGAEKVSLVIPNFGYAKSDKEKVKGQSLSARAILNILESLGDGKLNLITSINIHSQRVVDASGVSFKSVSAMNLLAEYFKGKPDLAIVSPDDGGVDRALEFASFLGINDIAIIEKNRVWNNPVKVVSITGEVEGRDCVIVDDRVESGDTIEAAVSALRSKKAGNIFVASVHMDYLGGGYLKLDGNENVSKILTTNTTLPVEGLSNKFEIVDITSIIREVANNEHE